MSGDIKDASLVISDVKSEGHRIIIIKRKSALQTGRDTKLGDVLDFLPSGLIHKEETGLGATTLELECERHSIIFEPIKITASSKLSSTP